MRTFVLVASLFSCTNAWFGIAPEPGLTPGAAGKITMFSMNDDGAQRNSSILAHTVDKQAGNLKCRTCPAHLREAEHVVCGVASSSARAGCWIKSVACERARTSPTFAPHGQVCVGVLELKRVRFSSCQWDQSAHPLAIASLSHPRRNVVAMHQGEPHVLFFRT
jgi:hypothetical protein